MVMKLPSLFKNRDSSTTTATTTSGSTYSTTSSSTTTAYSWQWPSCKHPKTNSFRGAHDHKGADDIFKTVNSVYFDASSTGAAHDNNTLEAWFTNSSESGSFSTISEDHHHNGEESFEMVIRGLRSERLFFEPSTDTNSILEESKQISSIAKDEELRFKESVVMAMDSEDPYVDFRTSMEEMVEAHGLKDWDCLEELLSWYLKVNVKNNHGYIVSAFVDLLVSIAAKSSNDQSKNKSSSSPTCSSSSSDETSCTGGTSLSPSFSSLLLQDPDEDSSSVSVSVTIDDDQQKTSKLSCSEISEI